MKKPALLALGLVLALGACSGQKSDDSEKKPAQADPSAADVSFPPDVVSVPPKLTRAKKANDAFELSACPTGPGEVIAQGTLQPTQKKRTDYVVTVTWKSGGKTVARSSALIKDSKRGEESSFQIRAALSKKADTCKAVTRSGKYVG